MRRILSFTISIVIGLWIVSAYIQKNLPVYTPERYLILAAGAGFVAIFVGIAGLLVELGHEIKKRDLNIKADPKLLIFIATIILGFFVHIFFLLISLLILLIPFKSSWFDKFLKQNYLPYLVIIAIALTGIFWPSNPLSTVIADQRAGNLNSVSISSGQNISQNFNTNSKNYNIGDWIASLSFNPDVNFYKGKEVELIGFVFHPEGLKDDEFLISRFVIRCCAADATPVGLKVKFDWQGKFKEGDWVKVDGKFDVMNIDGTDELVVTPSSMEHTAVPAQPYLS